MHSRGGGGGGGGELSLHDFLVATNCVHVEIQLQELGALNGGDLHEATDEELMELGMKKLEVRG